MSYRGKVWAGIVLFTMMTWGLIFTAAFSAEKPAEPKLMTWVHVWGCPRPISHVVLIFSNGKAVKLRVDDLSDEAKAQLVTAIGDVEGINIQYKCGTEV
jgi:hypothetical protein